jgi:hypothetical protein
MGGLTARRALSRPRLLGLIKAACPLTTLAGAILHLRKTLRQRGMSFFFGQRRRRAGKQAVLR